MCLILSSYNVINKNKKNRGQDCAIGTPEVTGVALAEIFLSLYTHACSTLYGAGERRALRYTIGSTPATI